MRSDPLFEFDYLRRCKTAVADIDFAQRAPRMATHSVALSRSARKLSPAPSMTSSISFQAEAPRCH